MLGITVAAIWMQTAASTDPNLLSIGRSGEVTVQPGNLISTNSGVEVSMETLVAQLKGTQFLYLGENHATKAHQDMHAAIVSALAESGRRVVVGLEMFTRPKQDILDLWSTSKLSESEFLEKGEWKTQWGYDYSFYRPVFEAAKKFQMPLVALNIPRDWVRQNTREGFLALPNSVRMQLPPSLGLNNANHRKVFDALMGGHGMGAAMDKMYASQVLWDESMADSLIKFRTVNPPSSQTIYVVIAGSGHVMYGQGINYRMAKRGFRNGKTLVMVQYDAPTKVSKGLGEYVFCSRPVKAEK